MKIEGLLIAGIVALGVGCASTPIPYKTPVAVTPPSGTVTVAQAVNLLDSSGSHEGAFAEGKATLESIVAAMPDGSYQAGEINFGGFERETAELGPFDRSRLAAVAKNATFLGETTPIYSIFEKELAGELGGGSGKAAIVLISDGLATDYQGRGGVEQTTVGAARALAQSRSGSTCFHTIQTGSDPAGTAVLQGIAQVSSCGSFRNASSLTTAAALQGFSREVYLGGAASAPRPTPAAAVDKDTDGDGVFDATDACPGTLQNARVDRRGCWTLKNLQFAVNGTGIETGFEASLQEAIAVLVANPGVRIGIDGYTDSDGSAAYNQSLSKQRAAAVRDYFVTKGGLSADRFEVRGFGEADPIVPNDSAANKRQNRRVQLTVLD